MVLQNSLKLPPQTHDFFIYFSLNERAQGRKKCENYLGEGMMMMFIVKIEG